MASILRQALCKVSGRRACPELEQEASQDTTPKLLAFPLVSLLCHPTRYHRIDTSFYEAPKGWPLLVFAGSLGGPHMFSPNEQWIANYSNRVAICRCSLKWTCTGLIHFLLISKTVCLQCPMSFGPQVTCSKGKWQPTCRSFRKYRHGEEKQPAPAPEREQPVLVSSFKKCSTVHWLPTVCLTPGTTMASGKSDCALPSSPQPNVGHAQPPAISALHTQAWGTEGDPQPHDVTSLDGCPWAVLVGARLGLEKGHG